jgi:hypothetical protein
MNDLVVNYTAFSDAATPVNLTNHTYCMFFPYLISYNLPNIP